MRHTQHNDHQVAEAEEAGCRIGIVAQARRPRLGVHRDNMSVLLASLLGRPGSGPSVGAVLRFALSDVVTAAPGD